MTRIREEEEVVHWARLLRRIQPGLFDMALKNLRSPNLGFLGFFEIKNLMSNLSF